MVVVVVVFLVVDFVVVVVVVGVVVVVVDVVVVVVVVVEVVVEVVVDVAVFPVVVEGFDSVVLFVVAMLLMGAMSSKKASKKGRSGDNVVVEDAFLAESVFFKVVVDPRIWSMAIHVNSWFFSGVWLVEGFLITSASSGLRENDSKDTTLPLPRMMEGAATGRGSRFSRNMLLVSLF